MKRFWFSFVVVFMLIAAALVADEKKVHQYGIDLDDVYQTPITVYKFESKVYEYEKSSKFVDIIESQSDDMIIPSGYCMFFRMYDNACCKILTKYGYGNSIVNGGLYMTDCLTGVDAILIYFNAPNDFKVLEGGGKLYRVDSDEYRSKIDYLMNIGRVKPFDPAAKNFGTHLEDY